MRKARLKLVVGVGAIAAALLYLGVTGARDGWVYYLSVDEYASRPETQGARSRVHGTVGPGATADPIAFGARFDLRGQARVIRVEYRGAVPDLFAEGREVVVEGTTDEAGTFVADVLLTKCGSKYEPAGAGG
ncbi:MAG: cytochrome c maturation protein CcmE [Phycisphaerales bacterium]|nr:cytochrome c maturation protein CcmE [Phycisphaerales bacterium]